MCLSGSTPARNSGGGTLLGPDGDCADGFRSVSEEIVANILK
jgi:hypothetical protein